MSVITESEQYIRRNGQLQREINRNTFKEKFSFEMYKKTPEDKLKLKIAKAEHKEYLRQLKGLV